MIDFHKKQKLLNLQETTNFSNIQNVPNQLAKTGQEEPDLEDISLNISKRTLVLQVDKSFLNETQAKKIDSEKNLFQDENNLSNIQIDQTYLRQQTNGQKLLVSDRSQILSLQRDLIPLNSQNSKRQSYNEQNSKCTKENKPSLHKIITHMELERAKKNESFNKENQNATSTYKSQFNTLETINKYRILDELKISLQKEIQNQEFSSINDSISKNNKIHKIYFSICNFLIYPLAIICRVAPIIPQHSLINTVWEFSSIAFNLILFYLLSIKALIGYNSTDYTVNIVVCWILFFLIVFDIFKMLITSSSYKNGQIFFTREDIIKIYLTNGFIYDFIPFVASVIGIFYYGAGRAYGEQNILEIIKFIKIITLIQRINVLVERINRQQNSGIKFLLIQMATILFTYFHILSICYFNIGYIIDSCSTVNSSQIWYSKYSLNIEESYNLYLYGLFEIQNYLFGSSDSNSHTLQILFLIVIRILSLCLFIFLLLTRREGLTKKIKQSFNHLKILNQNLCKSDKGYMLLNKIYSSISESQTKHETFRQLSNFSKLIPQNIYIELKQYFFQNFSSKLKLFSYYSEQINQIIPSIAEIQFLEEGQNVFLSGKFDECGGLSFYLLIQGEIELYQQPQFCSDTKKLFKIQKEGDIFGFQQFYTGQVRDSTAICRSNCILFKVNRQNFLQLIKQYNQDFEIFHMIKDTFFNEYSNEWSYKLKCSFCENYGHQNLNCPQVFYHPREKLLMRVNQVEIKNKRDHTFQRQQRKNKFSIINRQKILDAQQKYFLENEEFLLEYLVNYTDILNEINYEEESTFRSKSQSKSKNNNNNNKLQPPIKSNSFNDLEKSQVSFNLIPQKISKYSDYKGDLDDLELFMRLASSSHSIGLTKKQSERIISGINIPNEKVKKVRSQIEQQSIFKLGGQKQIEEEEINNNLYYNSFANGEPLSIKDIQENFFDSPRNNQNHSFSQASCSLFDNTHNNNGNNTICTQSLGVQNDKSNNQIPKSLLQNSFIKRINSGTKEYLNPSLIFKNAGILKQIKQNLNIQDSKFNQPVQNIILDQIQEYKFYFPTGNISNILQSYNRQIRYLEIQQHKYKHQNKIERESQPPQTQHNFLEENQIYIDCINTSQIRKVIYQDSQRSSIFNTKNLIEINNNTQNFQSGFYENNNHSVNIIKEIK